MILTQLWKKIEHVVYWLSGVFVVLAHYKEDVMDVPLSNLAAERFV